MGLLDCILCSPPYADSLQPFDANKPEEVLREWFGKYRQQGGGMGWTRWLEHVRSGRRGAMGLYGDTEGQIGALKEGQPMTSQETREVPVIEWAGCYSGSWRDFISGPSFGHPAKFARGLVQRILSFGLERGYWAAGSILGDPFAGIATGGLMACYGGLRWVGVELEPRFYRLANGWSCPGVTAAEWVRFQHRWTRNPLYPHLCPDCQSAPLRYNLDAPLGYKQTGKIPVQEPHYFQGNIDLHRCRLEKLGCPLPVMLQGDSRQFASIVGQCGAILTSPPYAETISTDRNGIDDSKMKHERGKRKYQQHGNLADPQEYGHTEGQIGSLPAGTLGVADGIVTSPPWEGIAQDHDSRENYEKLNTQAHVDGNGHGGKPGPSVGASYGSSEGQIGQQQGETYWGAVKSVYEQCWLSLKPGGTLVVVVKSYVRDKALVDLPGQTATLLTSLGFQVFLRVHALLTETTQEKGLFGEEIVTTKKKASFFRRLAEKKGSPPIDYEVVLFARKVGGEAGVLTGVVTSPPFSFRQPPANGRPGEETELRDMKPDTYGTTPGNLGNLPPGVPPRDGGEHE